jgi:hypothetical protein
VTKALPNAGSSRRGPTGLTMRSVPPLRGFAGDAGPVAAGAANVTAPASVAASATPSGPLTTQSYASLAEPPRPPIRVETNQLRWAAANPEAGGREREVIGDCTRHKLLSTSAGVAKAANDGTGAVAKVVIEVPEATATCLLAASALASLHRLSDRYLHGLSHEACRPTAAAPLATTFRHVTLPPNEVSNGGGYLTKKCPRTCPVSGSLSALTWISGLLKPPASRSRRRDLSSDRCLHCDQHPRRLQTQGRPRARA